MHVYEKPKYFNVSVNVNEQMKSSMHTFPGILFVKVETFSQD